MKKLISCLCACMLAAGLTACGTDQSAAEETENTPEVTEETEAEDTSGEAEKAEEGEKTLVVYFSCTGTTKDIAEKIADITGGDLAEIVAAEPYTDEDLNWHDESSRTSIEQNDPSTRPEISSTLPDLAGYSTVYIGYPIWWGVAPRIMETFVESCDFGNMTVIPFCTSGSSPIGNSGKGLSETAGSGNWLEGRRFAGGTSRDEIQSWIDEMN